MKLTVVGWSGSVSGPASSASCYLVQAPHPAGEDHGTDFSMVLDLGPGSLGALYNYLDPTTLGAVCLSHLHPDHCIDLCALYVTAAYSPSAISARIPVYGPAGTADRLARAYEVPPAVGVASEQPRLDEKFDFRTWADEQTIGPFTVRTAGVRHPTPAFALRVIETATGASVTYSGDTGPTETLVTLAEGTDVLLVESSFMPGPDNPPDTHLDPRQAAEIGAQAAVGTVVLTHIPPWHDPQRVFDEARPHFSGPLATAATGQVWTIRPGSEATATLTR